MGHVSEPWTKSNDLHKSRMPMSIETNNNGLRKIMATACRLLIDVASAITLEDGLPQPQIRFTSRMRTRL